MKYVLVFKRTELESERATMRWVKKSFRFL